jgi:hypothetical protein
VILSCFYFVQSKRTLEHHSPTRIACDTSQNKTKEQRQQLAQQHLLWQRLQGMGQLHISQA